MSIVAQSKAEVRWPQQQHVPLGGSYDVFRDARDGNVDYVNRINPSKIEAWPDGESKIGSGLGAFGLGAFGYGHGGAGWGYGASGLGMFGFGANWMTFVTPLLLDGTWEFAVVGLDVAGNAVTPAAIEVQATLAGTPRPPGVPTATAYDQATNKLTLGWTLSPDDEG